MVLAKEPLGEKWWGRASSHRGSPRCQAQKYRRGVDFWGCWFLYSLQLCLFGSCTSHMFISFWQAPQQLVKNAEPAAKRCRLADWRWALKTDVLRKNRLPSEQCVLGQTHLILDSYHVVVCLASSLFHVSPTSDFFSESDVQWATFWRHFQVLEMVGISTWRIVSKMSRSQRFMCWW